MTLSLCTAYGSGSSEDRGPDDTTVMVSLVLALTMPGGNPMNTCGFDPSWK